MKLDPVRCDPRLAVDDVEETNPVTVAVPRKSRKLLEADGGLPHEAMRAERAEAIRAFFGESLAPGQVGSGNSTIIVLLGALCTPTTR
jgi:hypothetical protein